MIRMSTGARAALIWDSGFRSLMWRGAIEIYTGTQPATADLAPSGTYLGRITEDGGGWTPGQLANGLRTKAGQTATSLVHEGNWVFNGVASGAPGWWRFVYNGGDTNLLSTFYPRLDGGITESVTNMPALVSASTEIPGIEFEFHLLGY